MNLWDEAEQVLHAIQAERKAEQSRQEEHQEKLFQAQLPDLRIIDQEIRRFIQQVKRYDKWPTKVVTEDRGFLRGTKSTPVPECLMRLSILTVFYDESWVVAYQGSFSYDIPDKHLFSRTERGFEWLPDHPYLRADKSYSVAHLTPEVMREMVDWLQRSDIPLPK